MQEIYSRKLGRPLGGMLIVGLVLIHSRLRVQGVLDAILAAALGSIHQLVGDVSRG
jgi:hypothetical protein